MKRRIAAVIAAIAMATGIGIVNSSSASAEIQCAIYNDPVQFIDPSHYYIRGAGATQCNPSTVFSTRFLLVIKKQQPDGDWVNVPGTSTGWIDTSTNYTRKATGVGYCYGSSTRNYRVEMSHQYNGGPVHYHQGPQSTLACNS